MVHLRCATPPGVVVARVRIPGAPDVTSSFEQFHPVAVRYRQDLSMRLISSWNGTHPLTAAGRAPTSGPGSNCRGSSSPRPDLTGAGGRVQGHHDVGRGIGRPGAGRAGQWTGTGSRAMVTRSVSACLQSEVEDEVSLVKAYGRGVDRAGVLAGGAWFPPVRGRGSAARIPNHCSLVSGSCHNWR